MAKRYWVTIGLTLAALSSPAPAGTCPVDVCVRFDPPVTVANPSDVFTIDIVADINTPIVGWGMDLTIVTPTVASLTGGPVIPFPWLAAFAPDGDQLAGLASPFDPVFGAVSGTDIILATLTFTADAPLETDLLLSITAGDATEGFALDPTGFAVVQFETGKIIVPEPAGLILLACCLPACLLLRRRSRWIDRQN